MRAWTDRRLTRFVFLLGALGLLVAVGVPALAGSVASPPRVKYYLVTATADGEAETLPEIAMRLLDSADRAEDIYELNEGRTQADGGMLTRGGPLHVGWVLVLPWDAIGDGVRYGVLVDPAATPAPTPASTAASPTATAAEPTAVVTSPRPSASVTSAQPSAPSPSPSTTTPAAGDCTSPPASTGAASSWAQQQLAAQDAWTAAGRGSGVVVAVIDSGVDGSVPQLSGRVSTGVDVVTGTGAGTTDCLGTGTAMAALIVGDDPQGMLGVAPDATVVPVRVAVDQATATASDQATAIDVAVSTGARVIALGSYVDISLPGVRQSINNAASHDVVVVVAGPVPDDGSLPRQLLRVGVLNSDGRLAQAYPRGTIDVVAPGQDVATLGVGGQGQVQVSGAQYAVALVAGAAALVRGAAPGLPAEQVVEQLRTTATPLDPEQAGQGDSAAGTTAALVNLSKAVAVTPAAPAHRLATPQPGGSSGTLLATAAVLVVLSIIGGVLLLRRRARPRPAEPGSLDQTGIDDWSQPR